MFQYSSRKAIGHSSVRTRLDHRSSTKVVSYFNT